MIDTATVVMLAIAAFFLGACPFSLWIGRAKLRKDIRNFGDGNPGASNVFKAGGKAWGVLALIADMLKGMPFILIAEYVLGYAQPVCYIIAVCAVLGHAYSPSFAFTAARRWRSSAELCWPWAGGTSSSAWPYCFSSGFSSFITMPGP